MTKSWKEGLQNAGLVVGSLLVFFCLLEASARILAGQFHWENYRKNSGTLFRSAYPARYDARLGWALQEGFSGGSNRWNTKVSVTADGVRSNGATALPTSLPVDVVAVGDSFTFGDEVSDDETWPAQLEGILKRRVVNGGVFGYGIDQTVLRGRQLLEQFRPRILIVSILADDIERCELDQRNGVAKPYFSLGPEGPVLQNDPVPPPPDVSREDIFRRFFGYSFFVHVIMKNYFKAYWLQGRWESHAVHPRGNGTGERIACRLLADLVSLQTPSGPKVVVLAQYPNKASSDLVEQTQRVLACLDRQRLKVVDPLKSLEASWHSNSPAGASLYTGRGGHMTAAGNRFIAEQLYAVLRLPTDQGVQHRPTPALR